MSTYARPEQQRRAALRSAASRSSRGVCPTCGKQSVERVVMPITAPLLPVGCIKIRCGKCHFSDVVETRIWNANGDE